MIVKEVVNLEGRGVVVVDKKETKLKPFNFKFLKFRCVPKRLVTVTAYRAPILHKFEFLFRCSVTLDRLECTQKTARQHTQACYVLYKKDIIIQQKFKYEINFDIGLRGAFGLSLTVRSCLAKLSLAKRLPSLK